MSWRTIVVKESQKIFVRQNQFAFQKEEETILIPFHDIDCVVLENNYTFITPRLLVLLAEYNIFLLVCDERHDPSGIFLPFSNHWAPLEILNLQIKMGVHFKKQIWTSLIKAKLQNSILVLEKLQFQEKEIIKIKRLHDTLLYNDVKNYEGAAAAIFFRCLYGSSFVRHTDTGINRALDYGYKILLSAISRSLAKYGLNNHLGVFHIGKQNAFNLACDLIEPFRPLVDYFVTKMGEEISEQLEYNQRLELIKILQYRVDFDQQIRTVSNAVELMVKSFLTSLKTENTQKLKLPRFLVLNNNYHPDVQ